MSWNLVISISHIHSSQLYLNQVAKDLTAYAQHAGRCTLDKEDAVLLLRRLVYVMIKIVILKTVNSRHCENLIYVQVSCDVSTFIHTGMDFSIAKEVLIIS